MAVFPVCPYYLSICQNLKNINGSKYAIERSVVHYLQLAAMDWKGLAVKLMQREIIPDERNVKSPDLCDLTDVNL